MSWKVHLIAVLALAALCALWIVFQRWIGRKDPELPGVDRRCADCSCDRAPGDDTPCDKRRSEAGADDA